MKWSLEGLRILLFEIGGLIEYLITFTVIIGIVSALYIILVPVMITVIGATGVALLAIGVLLLFIIFK
jgi:hypothetical protein